MLTSPLSLPPGPPGLPGPPPPPTPCIGNTPPDVGFLGAGEHLLQAFLGECDLVVELLVLAPCLLVSCVELHELVLPRPLSGRQVFLVGHLLLLQLI